MKKIMLAALGLSLIAAQGFAQNTTTAPDAGPSHFGHFDKGGDITRDEFMSRAASHFNDMDTNHDGKLSADERKAAFEKFRAKRAEWRAKHQSAGDASKPDAPDSGDNE